MTVTMDNRESSTAFRQIRSVLDRSPHFRALPPEKLDRLAALGRLVTYKNGECVRGGWQAADGLLIVVHGGLRLTLQDDDGTSFLFAIIGAGSFYSPALLPDGRRILFDAHAAGRTEAAEFSKGALCREFHGDLYIDKHFKERHFDKVRAMATMYRDVVALPLPRALSRRLLAQALAIAADPPDGEIELRTSQADLAEMLGASRTRVIAELKRLSRAGIVRLGYRTIVVRDWKRLCDVAGSGVVPL